MSRCQYALKTNRTYPKAKLGGKVLVKLWIENHIPLRDAIYREAWFASRTYSFQFTFGLLSVVYNGFEVWMIEEVAENLSGSVLKMSDSKSAMLRNLCTWCTAVEVASYNDIYQTGVIQWYLKGAQSGPNQAQRALKAWLTWAIRCSGVSIATITKRGYGCAL